MSKILVLNGSPRRKGNTSRMVEEFVKGAQEAGHEIIVENIGSMNIKGCLACEYCHTKGQGECIQKDDMQKIYPELNEVDTIIFASSVYYFTMTAQIHSAIQRVYALGMIPNVKRAAMILSSASANVYDAITAQYKYVTSFLGMSDKGIITAPGIDFSKESEEAKQKLKEVYELGKNI